jgi:hypothetical protein
MRGVSPILRRLFRKPTQAELVLRSLLEWISENRSDWSVWEDARRRFDGLTEADKASIPAHYVERLAALLRKGDQAQRSRAVTVAERLGASAAPVIPDLIYLLQQPAFGRQRWQRVEILKALGAIDREDPRVLHVLVKALEDTAKLATDIGNTYVGHERVSEVATAVLVAPQEPSASSLQTVLNATKHKLSTNDAAILRQAVESAKELEGRYVVAADGAAVIDQQTHLMWGPRDPTSSGGLVAGLEETCDYCAASEPPLQALRDLHGRARELLRYWTQTNIRLAEEFIVSMNSDRYADFGGWRLPTVDEAESLRPCVAAVQPWVRSRFDRPAAVWTSERCAVKYDFDPDNCIIYLVNFLAVRNVP